MHDPILPIYHGFPLTADTGGIAEDEFEMNALMREYYPQHHTVDGSLSYGGGAAYGNDEARGTKGVENSFISAEDYSNPATEANLHDTFHYGRQSFPAVVQNPVLLTVPWALSDTANSEDNNRSLFLT